MANDGNNGGDAPAAAPAAGGAQPQAQANAAPSISVLGQYIKDLSFENPRGAESFTPDAQKSPPLNVQVNVAARPVGQNIEAEIRIEARAGEAEAVVFNVELVYAGLFRVQNVPAEHLQPFVLIECPRLLFPFARQIVAQTLSAGGFPPVMLDPIDFAALYRNRVANQQAQAAAPTAQA